MPRLQQLQRYRANKILLTVQNKQTNPEKNTRNYSIWIHYKTFWFVDAHIGRYVENNTSRFLASNATLTT